MEGNVAATSHTSDPQVQTPTPPSPAEPIEQAFNAAIAGLDAARDRAEQLAAEHPARFRHFFGMAIPKWDAEESVAERAAEAVLELARALLAGPNAPLPELTIHSIEVLNRVRQQAMDARRRARCDRTADQDVQRIWGSFSPVAAYQELADRFDPRTVHHAACVRTAAALISGFGLNYRFRKREPIVARRGAIELQIDVYIDKSDNTLHYQCGERLSKTGAALTAFARECLTIDQQAQIAQGEPIWSRWLVRENRRVASRQVFEVGAGIMLTTYLNGNFMLRIPEAIGAELMLFIAKYTPAPSGLSP